MLMMNIVYTSETISSFCSFGIWYMEKLLIILICWINCHFLVLRCYVVPLVRRESTKFKTRTFRWGKDRKDGKTNRNKSEGTIIKIEETAVRITGEFTFLNVSKKYFSISDCYTWWSRVKVGRGRLTLFVLELRPFQDLDLNSQVSSFIISRHFLQLHLYTLYVFFK